MKQALKELKLSEIAPSATNPRKTFDPAKLQELAKSIASKGVLEPLLVRPHPNPNGAKYELVAGERRFRAATIAEVPTVPCIVRELEDVEALEVQTIENLQRDDLHPLEEAEGYAALMKEAGYDVQGIAERIGKSGKYVYDRIKLLQLIPELQKVFLDGEITAGRAILLARLSPSDQERALKGGGYGFGSGVNGLFTMDHGTVDDYGLDLDDPRRRKAVSVRELAAWIDHDVRFRPEEVDLPNLFPETEEALKEAEDEKLKIVKITREYRVPDAAKDQKERTYGRDHWKRADGQPDRDPWARKPHPTKTCEHAVLGVVVAGPGRGEAFRVCIAKKKCEIHWKEEQKAAAQRGVPNGAGTAKARQEEEDRRKKWREQQQKEQEERARWNKAKRHLMEAVAEKLQEIDPLKLSTIIVDACTTYNTPTRQKLMAKGKTVEDLVRYAAFMRISGLLSNEWAAMRDAPRILKRLGLNARKLVDEAAPKPKKKPAPKAKKKAPAKRKRRAPATRKAKSADVVKGAK